MKTPSLDSLHCDHLAELDLRYARILAEHSLDALVLHSGVKRPRREWDDQYWPLVTAPHFAHWLPLQVPDCLIVVRAGRRPLLIRFVDDSFWEQPPAFEVPPGDAFEVVEVREATKATQYVPSGTSGSGSVAFVGERGASVIEHFPAEMRNPPSLLAALEATRTRKTAYEVECLAEANRRASAGHKHLADLFAHADRSELHLHLSYLETTAQDDAETPYKNIVAKGAHAATLHHVTYSRDSRGEGSLLVDAGANFRGYGSDITRTHVRGQGAAAGHYRALLGSFDAMQRRLCDAVRVGAPYEELHDHAHVECAGVLREAGLVTLSVEEAVTRGVTRAFFPHGLGHSLGLQTHDVGCALIKPRPENPFLRNTSRIAAGQVFTVEPGVYFIDSLLAPLRAAGGGSGVDWGLVDALSPFGGIRIEDDLFVTDHGVRNLTREAFG